MYKKKNIFRRLFDFSGRITVGQFWSGIGMRIISFLCAVIIMLIVLTSVVQADEQTLIGMGNTLTLVLAVLWCMSIVKLMVRRLRDGGHSAKNLLWLLVPVVGLIVLLVQLFAKSVD